MTHSSTLSICFGLLLLICMPFYLAEVEYHEEATVEPITDCIESELNFNDRLIVCNNSGVRWYHFTGPVDSVVEAEMDRLWIQLQ